MNTDALLIFGKVIAWIFLALFSLLIVAGIYGVAEHNSNRFAVMLEGEATLRHGRIFFFLIMMILSAGFLIGTCGVQG